MAYDILSRKQTHRNWSCPSSITGKDDSSKPPSETKSYPDYVSNPSKKEWLTYGGILGAILVAGKLVTKQWPWEALKDPKTRKY
jgi:hypothetical protein